MRAGLLLLLLSVALFVASWSVYTAGAGQVPTRSYACARLAPEGLPNFPHTCALTVPHRDGTADLFLQRRGITYERCTVAAPFGPPGAYCR